ncbi:MAG: hypothetical protein HN704_07800 [Bacteroidetes bacterium]|nr:hypothetical protein [Bacteroidota bacterium]MBT6685016.1 hypothetical protein [Bacteroidota bacterium]MBT7143094.1 hypothetical protein [Bacteroidota bacterium]MBT7491493.1 hypothetical protein [Bacteroidota bacterium]
MKKILKLSSLFLLFVVLSNSLFAQKAKKPFSGIITYGINAEGFSEAEKLQLPKTIVVTYLGSKTKTVTQMPTQEMVILSDYEKKEVVMLQDIMGNMIAMDMSGEIAKELEKAKESETKFTYSDETKKIAGYDCKKVVAITETDTLVGYYTEDLNIENANWNSIFEEVKGVMLEYEQPGLENKKITIFAQTIKKKKIKEKVFNIPDEYERKTIEELQEMFGG